MPTEPLRSIDRDLLPVGTPSSHPIRPLTRTTTPTTRTARRSLPSWRHTLLATGLTLALAACGGSGGESGDGERLGLDSADSTELQTYDRTKAGPTQAGQRRPGAQNTGASSRPAATAAASNHPRWTLTSPAEASRFLAQASYGSSPKDIKALTGRTANEWIEAQFSRPATSLLNTMRYWRQRRGPEGNKKVSELEDAHNAWWYSTVQQDQLRQRVAFALSQIFVVSTNGDVSHFPKGIASYYDMLPATPSATSASCWKT